MKAPAAARPRPGCSPTGGSPLAGPGRCQRGPAAGAAGFPKGPVQQPAGRHNPPEWPGSAPALPNGRPAAAFPPRSADSPLRFCAPLWAAAVHFAKCSPPAQRSRFHQTPCAPAMGWAEWHSAAAKSPCPPFWAVWAVPAWAFTPFVCFQHWEYSLWKICLLILVLWAGALL